MKPLFLFILLSLSAGSWAQEPEPKPKPIAPNELLKKSLWKHRVILVQEPQKNDAWRAILAKEKAALKERHLLVIPLDEKLRKAYRVKPEIFTVILIGKDGGEKARQTKKADLPRLFRLIDQMPMRREEMRSN